MKFRTTGRWSRTRLICSAFLCVPLIVAISLVSVSFAQEHEHADGDGHDHASESPQAKESHDEHDHDDDQQPGVVPKEQDHEGHDHGEHGDEGEEGHTDEVKLTPQAIERYGIRVEPVKTQPLVASFIAPARISFNTESMAHIGSVVSGRVAELNVRLGDEVKKGDVLFVVESPELGEAQSDYLLKRTAVDTAQPTVELAKNAYDRAKALFDQSQGIALTEVQRREIEFKAAQGELRAAQAEATAAENKLHLYGMNQEAVQKLATSTEIDPRYTVVAPIAGQVVEREITMGELVQPDRDALLVLADMTTLWVLADIPESRLGEVKKGANARIKVATMQNVPIEGKVSFIAPSLDPTTRTARLRIEVSGSTGLIKPGMFAQAEISAAVPISSANSVLAIPEEAVQVVEGGAAVFVPVDGEANTFAKRSVTIGHPVGGMVPVMSGLSEGDEIVTAATFILKAELGKGGAAHEH
jgi:cobalt-zinc-cadmium efflux system membrane fusion protein